MKKISNYTQFEVDKIYNRVYIGPNRAYGEMNGKETFIVTSLNPLVVHVLYADNGSLSTPDIRENKTTFSNPDYAFKEFELFEPEGEHEWFKKSAKCSSIAEAIQKKLLTPEQVKCTRIRQSNITYHWSGKDSDGFHSYDFMVEPTSEFPFLQSVYIVWDNYEVARKDAEFHGITIQN